MPFPRKWGCHSHNQLFRSQVISDDLSESFSIPMHWDRSRWRLFFSWQIAVKLHGLENFTDTGKAGSTAVKNRDFGFPQFGFEGTHGQLGQNDGVNLGGQQRNLAQQQLVMFRRVSLFDFGKGLP